MSQNKDLFDAKTVYLRGLELDDLVHRPVWFNDPEINHTLLMDYPISYAKTLDWFHRSIKENKSINLSIIDKKAKIVIGMTGLLNIDYRNSNAQFYITIGNKDFWGQNIATQVIPRVLEYGFKHHRLHKIYLWTIPENSKARKVYERNGFKEEAHMREHYLCRGERKDIIQHAILYEDFYATD